MAIFASRDEAYEHLIVDGFIPGYTDWIAHGELPSILASKRENQHNNVEALGDDDMQGLVHGVFGVPNEDGYTDGTNSQMDSEIANGQAREFYRLIDDSNQPLYEGCAKFSKLSFIIRLLHLKCLGRLNNKVFDMLLDLLRDVFPDAMVGLPKSYYEADKLIPAPWMCMKESSFMLSILIPGPSSTGQNIDIYLQPLIVDLKDLWEVGVETYDASKKQNFQLRASLLWTISDFPGYTYLSGWSTQGEYACPICNKETHFIRLKHGGKYCYMGHRRFLPKEHEFRKNRRLFDGTVEYGEAPQLLSGDMVMDDLRDFTMKYVPDGYASTISRSEAMWVGSLPLDVSNIERYLGTLKSYVHNRSKPEGSIAEGYLAEECLRFCSLYLADYVESKFNRASRNKIVTDNAKIGLDVFTINGRSLGKGIAMRLDDVTLTKAHQYVLFNCEAVRPYIEQYWAVVEQSNPRVASHQLERIHSERFAGLFAQYARHNLQLDDDLGREYSLMLRVSDSLIATCSSSRMTMLFSNRINVAHHPAHSLACPSSDIQWSPP
ncbi:hypothetical protein SASPL_133381 [Salvia splendens]|uniref:DUF4218 domain-containing protein n=1 Tax=Salvia splendens TaxID=180675 RepID=A0A8X8X3P3_SALSN|nr:hypothetical protein SASPL_133381 [Salvia splendens]